MGPALPSFFVERRHMTTPIKIIKKFYFCLGHMCFLVEYPPGSGSKRLHVAGGLSIYTPPVGAASGLLKSFLCWPSFGLYFSHHYTYYKLQSFTCWISVGSFHVLHVSSI